MDNAYDNLKNLIDYLHSSYTEIARNWMLGDYPKINIKKFLVSDIDNNEIIYKSIMKYIELLNDQTPDVVLQFPFICSYVVRSRIKAQNSIEYKIKNYKTADHNFGKIPIKKCLNDLFGVRITLDPPSLDFEQILSFIDETYQGKFRYYDASKGDYRAIHLYIKENNKTFPWELQIWNKCDAQKNVKSHMIYKQAYTTWEKESKEGGIIDDQALYYYE